MHRALAHQGIPSQLLQWICTAPALRAQLPWFLSSSLPFASVSSISPTVASMFQTPLRSRHAPCCPQGHNTATRKVAVGATQALLQAVPQHPLAQRQQRLQQVPQQQQQQHSRAFQHAATPRAAHQQQMSPYSALKPPSSITRSPVTTSRRPAWQQHHQQERRVAQSSKAAAPASTQQQQQQQATSPYQALWHQKQRRRHSTAVMTPTAAAAVTSPGSSSMSTLAAAASAAAPHAKQQQVQRAPQQEPQQQRQGSTPYAALHAPWLQRRAFFARSITNSPQQQQPPVQQAHAQQRPQQQLQQLQQQQAAYSRTSSMGGFIVAVSAVHAAPPMPDGSIVSTAAGPGRSSAVASSSSSSKSGTRMWLHGPRTSRLQHLRAAASRHPCMGAGEQQQQQHQAPGDALEAPNMPQWHNFDSSSSSSITGSRRHHATHPVDQGQQQQHVLPPELLQPPPSAAPAVVDISYLLDMELQADAADHDSWDSRQHLSSSSRRSKSDYSKRLEQQQRALQSVYGQQQQLLWVTMHQPKGAGGPAAVWVRPWCCTLNPEQLRFKDGPSGSVSVLLELQERPELGTQPAAVVEGLTFTPTSTGFDTGSSSSSESGSSSSSSESDSSSSENSSSSSSESSSAEGGCVYDYLLLSSGDFSPLEHENMFPNAMVHCGDGRQMHSARGAHDLAAFVAEAELHRVQGHCENLLRIAWEYKDKGRSPAWVYEKLQQRWGLAALVRLGVDAMFVRSCLYRVMGQVPPPLPSVAIKANSTLSAAAAGGGVGVGVGAARRAVGVVANASVAQGPQLGVQPLLTAFAV